MTITYDDGTANRAITEVFYKDGATQRTIVEVWYGDAGTNRLVFSAGGGGVNIVGGTITHSVADPSDASTAYFLNSTGSEASLPAGQVSNTWLLSGIASDYEVRATLTSGSLTSGTTGTWLSLGTSRSWTRDRNTAGVSQAVMTIEIRNATTLVVLDSASVTLTAEVVI